MTTFLLVPNILKRKRREILQRDQDFIDMSKVLDTINDVEPTERYIVDAQHHIIAHI